MLSSIKLRFMMKLLIPVFVSLMMLVVSCTKEDLVWNLPRTNTVDSLQNQNPLNPDLPVARFSSSDTSVPIGSSINFLSTSLGNPTSYLWTFDGGVPSNTNQGSASVEYNAIGKYDVSLKVSNQFGSDSILKTSFIEAFYLKSFGNNSWDGWSNSGWSFTSSLTCPGCIYAWESAPTPSTNTISKLFNNVPVGAKLEFYYYVYSPSGILKAKVNGVEVWSTSQYGSNFVSIPLPSLSSFNLSFEATVGNAQTVYLNDIKIRP